MKRFVILLFALVVVAGSGSVWAATARNVTPDEAFRLVGQGKDLYLLDVRTFGEYQQARLDGARLIPIDQLVKRINEIPREQPVLVYCAVGSRSAQVVNYLARQGYPEVYNLSGGIYAWANRGYPYLQGLP
jgi:rhodanese-related sulfurtransferase